MSKKSDMVGKIFGRLTVLGKAPSAKSGNIRWFCQCECGNETIVYGSHLRNGNTKSCGCLAIDTRVKMATKHNMSGTRLYNIWSWMKRRCNDSKVKSYPDYGGRGITYCDEWEQFKPFFDWAMSNGYSDKLTIDRIDVNGNYEPSNCRWADKETQANNTRKNVLVTINGISKSMPEWAEKSGISVGTLWWRYYNGKTGKDFIKKARVMKRT